MRWPMLMLLLHQGVVLGSPQFKLCTPRAPVAALRVYGDGVLEDLDQGRTAAAEGDWNKLWGLLPRLAPAS